MSVFGDVDEVEHVGILEEIGCSGGPHRLHRRVEVRDRPSLALMEPCLDLVDEDVTRPAMFDGGPRVPKPLSVVLELVQECDILAPGQLCNDLLHNLLVGPGQGQFPHIFQVSRRETSHVWELRMQIRRQLIDDAGAPLVSGLPLNDLPSDSPVQQDHFAVDGERCAAEGTNLVGPGVLVGDYGFAIPFTDAELASLLAPLAAQGFSELPENVTKFDQHDLAMYGAKLAGCEAQASDFDSGKTDEMEAFAFTSLKQALLDEGVFAVFQKARDYCKQQDETPEAPSLR